MIKRGLNQGFWSSFNVRIGGVIGNMIWLIISWKGLSYLVNQPIILTIFAFLGSCLLFYMGINTLRQNNDLIISSQSLKI